jgi:hypothetical protein
MQNLDKVSKRLFPSAPFIRQHYHLPPCQSKYSESAWPGCYDGSYFYPLAGILTALSMAVSAGHVCLAKRNGQFEKVYAALTEEAA